MSCTADAQMRGSREYLSLREDVHVNGVVHCRRNTQHELQRVYVFGEDLFVETAASRFRGAEQTRQHGFVEVDGVALGGDERSA